jgi:hypothetical protein
MSKSVIKIVKINKEDESRKSQVSSKAVKTEKVIKVGIVHTVNNWIDERRKNNRREKISSDNQVAAWRLLPKTF